MSIKRFFAKRSRIRAMKHIVDDVNREIIYKVDAPNESWKPACLTERHGFGDCEDYAILMRERLILAGYITPREGRLGFVSTSGDDRIDHAVLILEFDKMDYVADNNLGMQRRLYKGWSLVLTMGLTNWWDTQYPVGMTLEQYQEIK